RTPPRFGSSVVSCSSRCAAWRAGSSIWPMRQLTENPTSLTCSRRWNQRGKLKQSRKLPTAARPTRQCRQSRPKGPLTAGLARRPVETGEQDQAPTELKGAEKLSDEQREPVQPTRAARTARLLSRSGHPPNQPAPPASAEPNP